MTGKRHQPPGTPTPRAQKAYDLRRQGLGWDEIGAQLGVKAITARNYAGLCEKSGQDTLKQFRHASPEIVNPEKSAELIDGSLGPNGLDSEKFMELAAQAGLPARMAKGLMVRWGHEYSRIGAEGRLLKGKQLADELSGKLGKLVDNLDDYTMANMSGKDLSVAIGILTDKVLLLEGKPSVIYDVNVSHKLEVLMPQFMAEAKRRGLTIDSTATVISETQP